MRMPIAIALSAVLCACSVPRPFIKSEALSFDEVIEDTTNKILVMNILRARDQAPLHFASIPQLRESITHTGSATTTIPFGQRNGSNARASEAIGLTFSTSPSFDITNLDSKDFVTGMSSPIDPKFAKYWVDRGLDKRLVLLLFFSGVEITEVTKVTKDTNDTPPKKTETTHRTTITIENRPRDAIEVIRARLSSDNDEPVPCHQKSQFERYLSLVNDLKEFTAQVKPDPQPIGTIAVDPKDSARFLQALAAAEQAKLRVEQQTSDTYKVSSSPGSKILFCFYHQGAAKGGSAVDAKGLSTTTTHTVCELSGEELSKSKAEDSGAKESPVVKRSVTANLLPPPSTAKATDAFGNDRKFCEVFEGARKLFEGKSSERSYELRLLMRSPGEMIRFLGDVLYYQDALKGLQGNGKHAQLNNPVTLGYCEPKEKASKEVQGRWDVLFNLENPADKSRFTLRYRGKDYSVGNFDPVATRKEERCASDFEHRKDHTLEVLSVVHQVINLHKSATDVKTTPAVHVVP